MRDQSVFLSAIVMNTSGVINLHSKQRGDTLIMIRCMSTDTRPLLGRLMRNCTTTHPKRQLIPDCGTWISSRQFLAYLTTLLQIQVLYSAEWYGKIIMNLSWRFERRRSWPAWRNYPAIFLDILRKTTIISGQGNPYLARIQTGFHESETRYSAEIICFILHNSFSRN
jgi:hypothetical protein